MMSEWLDAMQKVGFPIVLVAYLLTRFEPLLRALPIAIASAASRTDESMAKNRRAIYEMRRAQLLYIIGHPAFSQSVKQQAKGMLEEPTEGKDDSE